MALSYTKKTWKDAESSGTPVTAADFQKYEDAISSLLNDVNDMKKMYTGYKVYSGSIVTSTWYGSEARLFTESEFSSMFGRSFDQSSDSISVMNGDGKAYGGTIVQVRYYPNSKKTFSLYTTMPMPQVKW